MALDWPPLNARTVTALPKPAPIADALQLEAALHLLRASGYECARTPPSLRDAAWLQTVIESLCDLSSRDALTGLANRRQFELVLEGELDRVARSGEMALVLLLDIDHFKAVNDEHGHAAGDLVLQAVAQRLNECVRPMDTVARYGGEEFAIILPNCSPAFGQAVAERLRRRVASRPVGVAVHTDLRITVSVGGAYASPWVRSSVKLWMERADTQLYRAKEAGRNRTSLEPAAMSDVSAEEKGMLFSMATLPAELSPPELDASHFPRFPE
ncbi:MAG TPA: GGDEF domain-containing protein [Burkholderiaceae bacterium]|jgi:diguanylate cyclase (GGDEF)-like protein|nr:GGDEF domain-containing protein [Burkholderiaceae bacterium]